MDAFAENQMGREPASGTPAPPRRSRKASKETYTPAELVEMEMEGSVQPTLPVFVASDIETEVPSIGIEESALIKQRWNRKQATFMPVGDPYAEPDTSKPYATQLATYYCTCFQLLHALKAFALTLFPVIGWLPKLNKDKLRADVIAGLTVGVMLIPQSMSYADIAGLQYRYGLYTSVLPIITYALMGSSRQLGVGPVAMISLLVEVGLQGMLTEEECPEYFKQFNGTSISDVPDLLAFEPQYTLCPDAYAQLAFLTSLTVGVFQLAAGFLRLGFLVSFLAHPVISGFTSAAAIIIGLSQLQYFFGFKIPKSPYVYMTVEHILLNIGKTQLPQLALGLTWWFMLSASRRLSLKYKRKLGWLKPSAPLLTCVLAIIIGGNLEMFNGCGFQLCNATETNKLIVGAIPSGVSAMGSLNLLDLSKLDRVLSTAVSCSIIGYMESIAIAKSLAAKHKYEVDAGQELMALGVSNLLGSITSAYPVTGSFSRSAVNNQVGAQTQFAGLVTGCLMLLTLLLLTPLFYFLPKFALAAIVIASVTNLVDYKEAIHLFKVKKQDFLIWLVAFLGTLFLGVQIGLLISIGVSLAFVIIESIRPQMSMLWRLPGTPIYRNVKQESAGQFVPGIVVLRIGASMYFANVAFIRDYITKMLSEFSEAADTAGSTTEEQQQGKPPDPIRYIVVEMTPVTSIDSTAMHMLEDMHRDLKDRGIRLAFSTIGTRVEDTFKRAGLIDKIGQGWFHPSVHAAVQYCVRHRLSADDGESNGSESKPETPKGGDNASSSPVMVSAELEGTPGANPLSGAQEVHLEVH